MFKSRIDYKPCTLFPLETENSFDKQVVGIDEVLPALPDPVIGEAEEDKHSDGGPIFYHKETSHLTNHVIRIPNIKPWYIKYYWLIDLEWSCSTFLSVSGEQKLSCNR